MEHLILPNVNKILPRYFIKSGVANNYLAWVYTAIKNFDKDKIWDTNIINYEDIITNEDNIVTETLDKNKSNLFYSLINLDYKKSYSNYTYDIHKNLDWQYENKFATSLTSTLSVSEIKRIYQNKFFNYLKQYDENSFVFPKFYELSKESLTSMEIGSIYHKILENIDFNINNENELNKFLQTLLNKNILTQKEIDNINKNIILSFLNSEIVTRIKNCKNIKREAIFTLGVKANEIYKDGDFINVEDTILVSGIIDLYFEEDDGLVLLDYKTDKTKDKNEYLKRYKPQLQIYKKALQQSKGKIVKQCVIYSVLHNMIIEVY